MPFGRRLKLYLIGVLLGSLIVYVTLIKDKKRDFVWLPESRVVEQLVENELVVTGAKMNCLACLNISNDSLKEIIKVSNVDFGKSEVRDRACPIYFLSYKTAKGEEIELEIESCETKSVLKHFFFKQSLCDCEV